MSTTKAPWQQAVLMIVVAIVIVPMVFVSSGYRFSSGFGNLILATLTFIWSGTATYSGTRIRRLEQDEFWWIVLAGVIAPLIAFFVARGDLGPYPDYHEDESAFVQGKDQPT